MQASTVSALQVVFAVAMVISTAYAAGRVHQWSRHAAEREVAYREGYHQASRTLFPLAARAVPGPAPRSHPLNEPDAGPTRADRIGVH